MEKIIRNPQKVGPGIPKPCQEAGDSVVEAGSAPASVCEFISSASQKVQSRVAKIGTTIYSLGKSPNIDTKDPLGIAVTWTT